MFPKTRASALVGLFLLTTAILLAGQEAATKLDKVPISQSNSASAQQMYKDYCAACHGVAGKGDGPVVEYLKAPPPDLTTMAARNNGVFPAQHFAAVLRFGTQSHPHGTSDMPVWGPLFRSRDMNKDLSPLTIYGLSSYLESLQQK